MSHLYDHEFFLLLFSIFLSDFKASFLEISYAGLVEI